MSEDIINYGKLIDDAMHYVVRRTLEITEKDGLPGDHHFFITFDTTHQGVMISKELAERYPQEMTIVVQHQYWDLIIEEDRFSIVLSFDNVKQNLTIPFDALISFADPSVKFGLQFQREPEDARASEASNTTSNSKTSPVEPITDGSNVVTLDSFRKK